MTKIRKPTLIVPTRRQFISAAGLGLAGLGLYGAGFRPAFADLAKAGDWTKYKGTNLRLLLNNHWWTDAVKAKVADFEKLTGMKVTLDILSEDNYYQKAAVELSAGTGNYDGLMVGNLQAGQYMAAGWLAPLGDLIKGVVDPAWFNMDDIFQSGRACTARTSCRRPASARSAPSTISRPRPRP